jgi:phosphate:Na+ symporter
MTAAEFGIPQAAALLGGIGLFLLGMWLMTDGLRLAAGERLRLILSTWTSNRLRGFLSGVLVTMLVQSSSAVIVAILGFVNAGLLTLAQSVWVVFGANVGTTVTGWLVALIGVKFKIDLLALPLIGGGMLLRLVFGAASRWGALGQAIAGFGAFFLGVQVLYTTFESLGNAFDLGAIATDRVTGDLLFFGIGILLTLFTQSSSAALAIVLTAAAGGAVPLELAAAAVIGANIGTTSTALFAAIGATPNAKRVAASHIAFNVAAAAAALPLLPLLLPAVDQLRELFGLAAAPATALALFHTTFKLIGVALMVIFAGAMVRQLRGRFRSAEEDLAAPRHLDSTSLSVPELSLAAVALETQHLGEVARAAARKALAGQPHTAERNAALQLTARIRAHIAAMNAAGMPEKVAASLTGLLRAIQHYEEVAERSAMPDVPTPASADVVGRERQLHSAVERALALSDTADAGFDLTRAQTAWDEAEQAYDAAKSALLHAAATGAIPVPEMDLGMRYAGNLRRIAERTVKAAVRIKSASGAESARDDAAAESSADKGTEGAPDSPH